MRTFKNPAEIASHLIDQCNGHVRLALPLGLGKPNTIVNALTDAAMANPSVRLDVFTALTLERPHPGSELERRFLEPALDRLFGKYPALKYVELLRKNTLPDNIEISEFFLLGGKWMGVERVQRNYISANYTHAYGYLIARKPNVVAQLLARDGKRFSLSCNTDITADLISDRAKGKIDFVLAGELNSELPFMPGDAAEIEDNELACLLDNPQTDFELFSAVKQPIGDVEMAIGLHVSQLIEDGGTLQIGIGSIGDAVAQALLLRHRDYQTWQRLMDDKPFSHYEAGVCRHENLAELNQHHSDQGSFKTGLYSSTEMLVDGLLQLFEAGVLKREVDGVVMHAGFFVESRAFYKALRDMPEDQRAKISMQPVSFTNQLYGNEEGKRDARVKARFVNNAMMVTLLGAAISDGTGNGKVVSGVGGQFNFVDQAFALKDANSIITVKATREGGNGLKSNIVWNYPHTTIPRHLKDVVVTEYGIADLRGKSDEQTIIALLAITDSRFQDDLLVRAKREGKIKSTHTIEEANRHNTPQQLRNWLRQKRKDGTLPRFPFGTDFTDIEQRLLPALAVLKSAQSSKRKLATLVWAGRGSGTLDNEHACLKRMRLDKPSGAKEHVYALLLRGALRQSADD